MRMRYDAQQVASTLGRNQHISICREVGHQHAEGRLFKNDAYRFVSSAGRIAWHFGQATTRPRRGSVDVKFTWSRSNRTAFNVVTISLQCGHFTGDSSL
jgi:hypothetical protein